MRRGAPTLGGGPIANATDALWTQTARVQSRTTSTGLYICNGPTCRFAIWLDWELLTSTACGGLIIRRSWVRAPPAPPAISLEVLAKPWTGSWTDVRHPVYRRPGHLCADREVPR